MTRRGLLLTLMIGTGVLAETAFTQKQAIPKPSLTKFELAEQNVKELLLLTNADKDGKISKQEWMKFMEAEFDRLDQDRTGELDRKELLRSRLQVGQGHFADLGK